LKAWLGGVVDLTTVDWPRKACFLIFLTGCNLRCPFCQNSALIPMNSGESVDVDVVVDRFKRNLPLVEGVHVTGGEPTLQSAALRSLCSKFKSLGVGVSISTNGTCPQVLKELIDNELVDHIALDVKAPLEVGAYSLATGLSRADWVVASVKRSLEVCVKARSEGSITLEARTTVVPTLNDEEDSVAKIAKAIGDTCDYYVLQQFEPSDKVLDPRFKALKAPSREKLLRLAKVALNHGVRLVLLKTRSHGIEELPKP